MIIEPVLLDLRRWSDIRLSEVILVIYLVKSDQHLINNITSEVRLTILKNVSHNHLFWQTFLHYNISMIKNHNFWSWSRPDYALVWWHIKTTPHSVNVMRISFEKSKECGSCKRITKKNESWHSWSEMIADHDQIMASLVCGSYLGLENALIVP